MSSLLLLPLSALLCVVAFVLAVPVAMFCLEAAAALWVRGQPPRKPQGRIGASAVRPQLAVVVPAHDEERQLGATLRSVLSQLQPGDRLIVVADNCTDRTAEIAERAGAEVIVRVNPMARGKGYAMDAAVSYLRAAPPALVVFVDADCQLGDRALDALAVTALARQRPAQARFLCLAPHGARHALKVAEFAHVLKNEIRPRGLTALGLPCQLTGSGMAFPWPIIAAAQLASGEIVEDLKLGLDCALAGHPPVLCDAAVVTTEFPTSRQGADSQRERWQRGHLHQIRSALGPFTIGLRRGDLPLMMQVLDMLVPPLTLLLMANAALGLVGAVAALAGASILPVLIAMASSASLSGAIAAAWWMAKKGGHAPSQVSAFASYLGDNVALYPRLMSRAPLSWIRTDRGETQ
ncbi:glycosyltransferase family 2 protein [Methylobacterium sp. BTF04]|uniref:glycosyltransferase family 2 protein n=1 Tax=Methylobacterium sp. BTF04 TaxID=2708300 RepID=UPI0013D53285|nr:glycosyltransferase family 2 protein [Methylobacterium sp. BTF04]NEU13492.1 glycosyltransferase family 2 protein [Methylobacterium sp. BTF04]